MNEMFRYTINDMENVRLGPLYSVNHRYFEATKFSYQPMIEPPPPASTGWLVAMEQNMFFMFETYSAEELIEKLTWFYEMIAATDAETLLEMAHSEEEEHANDNIYKMFYDHLYETISLDQQVVSEVIDQ